MLAYASALNGLVSMIVFVLGSIVPAGIPENASSEPTRKRWRQSIQREHPRTYRTVSNQRCVELAKLVSNPLTPDMNEVASLARELGVRADLLRARIIRGAKLIQGALPGAKRLRRLPGSKRPRSRKLPPEWEKEVVGSIYAAQLSAVAVSRSWVTQAIETVIFLRAPEDSPLHYWKPSTGFMSKFLRRNKIVFKRSVSTSHTRGVDETARERFFMRQSIFGLFNLEASRVVNMDEVAFQMSSLHRYTYVLSDTRHVKLSDVLGEEHVTIIPAVMQDGTMIPPFVILGGGEKNSDLCVRVCTIAGVRIGIYRTHSAWNDNVSCIAYMKFLRWCVDNAQALSTAAGAAAATATTATTAAATGTTAASSPSSSSPTLSAVEPFHSYALSVLLSSTPSSLSTPSSTNSTVSAVNDPPIVVPSQTPTDFDVALASHILGNELIKDCNARKTNSDRKIPLLSEHDAYALAQKRPIVLFLDNAAVHRTRQVIIAAQRCGIIPVFLPANVTDEHQPLDVGVNKPMKDGMRDSWSEIQPCDRNMREQKAQLKSQKAECADQRTAMQKELTVAHRQERKHTTVLRQLVRCQEQLDEATQPTTAQEREAETVQRKFEDAKRQQGAAALVVAEQNAKLYEFDEQFNFNKVVKEKCWSNFIRVDRGATTSSSTAVEDDDDYGDEDYVPEDEHEDSVAEDEHESDAEDEEDDSTANDDEELVVEGEECEPEAEPDEITVSIDDVSVVSIDRDEWGLSTLDLEHASTEKNMVFAPRLSQVRLYCKRIDDATFKVLKRAASMSQKAAYEMYVLFCLARSVSRMQAKVAAQQCDDNSAGVESQKAASYWRRALIDPTKKQQLSPEFVNESIQQVQMFAKNLLAPGRDESSHAPADPDASQQQPDARAAKRRKSTGTVDTAPASSKRVVSAKKRRTSS